LNRAFFSRQSNWVPTLVAVLNLALNVVLDLVFYRVGVWGIPLATSLVNMAGAVALAYALRRRMGRLGLATIGNSVVRVLIAWGCCAGVAYGVWGGPAAVLGPSFPAQSVSLGGALLSAGAVYVVVCRVLRVAELNAVLGLLRRPPADS